MNRLSSAVLCLVVGLGTLGCDKLLKDRQRVENLLASVESANAAASAPPAVTAPSPAAAGTGVSDQQIPVPEDFEQQAAREITTQNLQAELEVLKKAIGP
jgi:hypothetical protein